MKCLILSILVLTCATVDGLSCIDREDPPEPLLDQDHDEFVKSIYDLPSTKVGDDDLCRVQLVVHLSWMSLIISFRKDLNTSELNDLVVQYETYIIPSEYYFITVLNTLEYACSEDDCDNKFIVDHCYWLIATQHSQLVMNITQLLEGEEKTAGECFVDMNTTEDCSAGYCLVEETEGEFEQLCDHDLDFPESFAVSTIYDLNAASERQDIMFRCKYDKCNSEAIFRQVNELVNQYYDMTPIRNLLGYGIKPTEEPNSTPTHYQTTKTQSTTKITMNNNSTTMKNSGLQVYCSNTVMYGVLILFIFDTFQLL